MESEQQMTSALGETMSDNIIPQGLSVDAQEIIKQGLNALEEGKDLDRELVYAAGALILKQDDISRDRLASAAMKEIVREYIKLLHKSGVGNDKASPA